jgi:cell division protein DivIC
MKKVVNYIPAFLKNKFIVATLVFIITLFFFGEDDLMVQYRRTQELKKLNDGKKYYTEQIILAKKELEQIKNDPAALEKYAREKYFMKKDNEDLFMIQEPAPAK